MKTYLLPILAAIMLLSSCSNNKQPIYKDASMPIEKRVDDLLSRMTLHEKIMQLNQYTLGTNDNLNNIGGVVIDLPLEIGSVIYFDADPKLRNIFQKKVMEESRLGIPVLFGFDAIHGFRTIYPISLAQACSFNPDLVEAACAVSAKECRMAGVDWTFSPMVDVAHDPRWGRVCEGYGEDPYLAATMCQASVYGYQGREIQQLANNQHIAACLKHFVGYGASEAGRDYVYTEISQQTLWDTYLLPFEWGVKAGAQTLMAAFNNINGTPASANHYTMTHILKDMWQHDGFVVSDWASIAQLIPQGMANDLNKAAELAFNAGLEMDMMSHAYDNHLEQLLKDGKISETQINEAVRRVLRVKMRLGLFENPYTPEVCEEQAFRLPEYIRTAQQLAEETFVLLKNDNNTLPIRNPKNIAVIGPTATDQGALMGSWYGKGQLTDVSLLIDAIAQRFNDANIIYAKGCGFSTPQSADYQKAIMAANQADIVILCLGEEIGWSGENCSRSTIALPQVQEQLALAIRNTGKPVVMLLSNGRPLDLSRIENCADAILETWQPGTDGASVIAATLAGDINPSGKLAMTFPFSTGQIPIYYARRKQARDYAGFYQDITSEPLYPFGWGLSYTSFEYGQIQASAAEIPADGQLNISINLTNTGAYDGKEVVMLFVEDPFCSITRPVRELRAYQKIQLAAGESTTVNFQLDATRDLSFVNQDGNRFVESGEYILHIANQQISINVK